MLPQHHLLQLTLPRVKTTLDRLHELVWTHVQDVRVRFGGSSPEHHPQSHAAGLNYTPVELPFHWGGLFDQGWFEVEWTPVEGASYFHWQEQGEGTLYLDDAPHYGFDVAHRYCPLPENASRGRIESLCLQSAIWHPAATGLGPRGSVVSKASICRRNDAAWKAEHDLKVLLELALQEQHRSQPLTAPNLIGTGYLAPVENATPLYRRVLRLLDQACSVFDRDGVEAMADFLTHAYKQLEGNQELVEAILTGHAHVDLVWLWPERVSEYKAVHTFSTVNRLMDLYPDFRFAYSQPASYLAVRRRSPKMWEQLKARVDAGTWEPLGATEVESDTILACGEALLRSFLLGQQHHRELFGKESSILWLPDVFGYSGCIPQMAAECGVKYFFTTKLTWSNIHLFPYSSFHWIGADGTRLLAHITQNNSYNQGVLINEITRGAAAYRQADVHDQFLAPTGYGDGGGGPTEEMCERAHRLRSLAGVPRTSWGRVDHFFENLERVSELLPQYQGELYLEYHRGTYTTHGHLKLAFRELERALQTWEAARVATGRGEIDSKYWERLIFAQFHDYIPGSSIWEVYEEGVPELRQLAEQALGKATEELGGEGTQLFNPLPLPRTVIRSTPAGPAACNLPALGTGTPAAPNTKPSRVRASSRTLESDRVKATLGSDGSIKELVIDGEPLALEDAFASLCLYPDLPHAFDAWEIDRQSLSLGAPVETEVQWEEECVNTLEARIRLRRKLGEKSSITLAFRVDAFQPVLHIDIDVEWHEENKLLKMLFPTAYRGQRARFGAPYGSALRPQQSGSALTEAMFESCGSRWASVFHDDESDGVAVITEAKYGWSCRDGVMGLSLLRSVTVCGEGRRPLSGADVRRGTPRPQLSDHGTHRIKLAIGRHSSRLPRHENPAALADILFTPAIPVALPVSVPVLPTLEGLESLVPAWVAPEADGPFVLRLHETLGRGGVLRIHPVEGTTVDSIKAGGQILQTNVTSLSVRPYQIVSLRIRRK
jgi:alpha-mannosidase